MARSCLICISPILDRTAISSAADALSPSTSPYDCSNVMLQERVKGVSLPYLLPIYPDRIRTPLSYIGPLSSTSLSIEMIPFSPIYELAVILLGFPNLKLPRS